MESVKKHAVVCEECSLIAHSKCKGNAPPTCGLRAQLLQYANYSSQPDSPNALDILQQFTPSSSPAFDTSGGDQDSTPHPPTSFKMFAGFRRSRSSLRTDATPPSRATSQASQTSSHDSVTTQPAQGGMNESAPTTPTTAAANRRRSAPLLKPEQYRGFGHMPRPLSMSSDGTPNHSSLRSAATAGGESDELELELSNSSNSHSQAASARSRRVTSVGSISIDEPDEDATIPDVGRPHQRFLKSRFSMSAASATETTSDARRVSIFAPSTVTGDDYGDERTTHEETATVGRRGGKKRISKTSDKEKDGKSCIVQ